MTVEVCGPSHFTTIGFPIRTEQDVLEYAQKALEIEERLEAESGMYLRWKAGDGAELWARTDRQGTATGLYPHFVGDVVVRGGLTRGIPRPDAGPLEGGFYFWTNAHHSDPESGDYPMVFDAPDYDLYGAVELPALVDVQLAAFASVLKAFTNDEQYAASRAGAALAVESFFPSGLFEDETGQEGELVPAEQPQALAVLSGRVLDTSRLTNPATRGQFFWAKVRTYGGEIEVVASPEVVEGTLIEGSVLNGLFWLTGRLSEHRQTENN